MSLVLCAGLWVPAAAADNSIKQVEAGYLFSMILTNGGAYPPDLILGRVEDFRQESHGISSYAAIRPAVDSTRLSTVFVVKDFNVEN